MCWLYLRDWQPPSRVLRLTYGRGELVIRTSYSISVCQAGAPATRTDVLVEYRPAAYIFPPRHFHTFLKRRGGYVVAVLLPVSHLHYAVATPSSRQQTKPDMLAHTVWNRVQRSSAGSPLLVMALTAHLSALPGTVQALKRVATTPPAACCNFSGK